MERTKTDKRSIVCRSCQPSSVLSAMVPQLASGALEVDQFVAETLVQVPALLAIHISGPLVLLADTSSSVYGTVLISHHVFVLLRVPRKSPTVVRVFVVQLRWVCFVQLRSTMRTWLVVPRSWKPRSCKRGVFTNPTYVSLIEVVQLVSGSNLIPIQYASDAPQFTNIWRSSVSFGLAR